MEGEAVIALCSFTKRRMDSFQSTVSELLTIAMLLQLVFLSCTILNLRTNLLRNVRLVAHMVIVLENYT